MLVSKIKKSFPSIIFSALPLLLFFLVLEVKIPYSFSRIFQSTSVLLLALVFFLFYICFRLQHKYAWVLGFSLAMLLFALTLSYKWTSGISNSKVIAGILPYKVGFNYYYGARLILAGLPLPPSGVAAYRPLFMGFLSTLLLMGKMNLQWALGILVGLTGICCFLSARQVYSSFGAAGAAVYMTLLYFFAQAFIGFVLTELLGLAFGCLGFILLCRAAQKQRLCDLLSGLASLVLGLSARAGAFFILPMLILWAGWALRKNRFSFRAAGYSAITVFAMFLIVNIIFPRLVGSSGNDTMGNFAFVLYGQVRGGTGWQQAFEDLNTKKIDLVYRAALQFFIEHPSSFFIGAAKSYRDFFLPRMGGIFSFVLHDGLDWMDILLWACAIFLLIFGLLVSAKQIRSSLPSLLVAGFIGILLSIPFLPPIDGGVRFYASTMPFIYSIPAMAISRLFNNQKKAEESRAELPIGLVRTFSILLAMMTIVVPVLTRQFSHKPAVTAPACPARQVPFAVQMYNGAYVNLIPAGKAPCGRVPDICLSDFIANGVEKSVDDFYQQLAAESESSSNITRIWVANDLIGDDFHFIMDTSGQLPVSSSNQLVVGCAEQIRTKPHSIYKIQAIFTP
jgi:hypothetical protein